jgi:NhaC family Na+:H+ antiporter
MTKTAYNKTPPAWLSLIPIAILVALLALTIYIFGSDALGGGSQISLLLATGVCVFIGMGVLHRPWANFEEAMVRNISGVGTAIIILLIIGALSGAWVVSGVVPTLIYYGVQVIHPDFFLLCTCIICAIVSVMTGSSWTTIATIGIALMGIGKAQGFSEGWIAGAIISGAYFGDKVSPLSDTTVLASSSTGTPLFTHIRYLMYTTVPSMILALIIFGIAGLSHEVSDTSHIALFTDTIARKFDITPWLLLVPVITGILIAKRVSSIITLFVSTILAAICAVIFQPTLLTEIAGSIGDGWTESVKGTFMMLFGATNLETGNTEVNELISTRGMAGMMDTIWLILCAMCFGGAMTAGGMIDGITRMLTRFTHHRTSMVTSTVTSGMFFNIATADQYISIILTGNIFKDIYRRNGYESRLLSRTTEDAVTVTSVLIPWNTCGMTQATILGVATLTYLPYCAFNLISPLMSILVAWTGYKIVRKKE